MSSKQTKDARGAQIQQNTKTLAFYKPKKPVQHIRWQFYIKQFYSAVTLEIKFLVKDRPLVDTQLYKSGCAGKS